jgi:hypothetical protein
MFKDIITYLGVSKGNEAIADFAVSVASALEAHITGIAMGFPSKKSNLSNANTKLPQRPPGTISLLQLPAPGSPPGHSCSTRVLPKLLTSLVA